MPSRPTGKRNQWRTATCEVCNKTFKTSRYDTTTCGPTCRSKKSRAVKKHADARAAMAHAVYSFTQGEHGPMTADDIETLKGIEYFARTAILRIQKQQPLPLGD